MIRRSDSYAVDEVSHERWLVSYADFMTLLMAFFVVMYSISQVSEQKYRVLSETFNQAFNAFSTEDLIVDQSRPVSSSSFAPIEMEGSAAQDRPGNDANEVPENFTRIAEQLTQSFEQLIEEDLITVTGDERWLQIELQSAILFESGGAILNPQAEAIIGELAEPLTEHNNVIRVEGFTDDVPIETPLFASNWELSSSRASAVVKLLTSLGIAPERLAAVGYGEHQPAASNLTAEGRAKNRRIVLMVSSSDRLRPRADRIEEISVADGGASGGDGSTVRGLELDARAQAEAWFRRFSPDAANSGNQSSGDSSAALQRSESAEALTATLPEAGQAQNNIGQESESVSDASSWDPFADSSSPSAQPDSGANSEALTDGGVDDSQSGTVDSEAGGPPGATGIRQVELEGGGLLFTN